MSYSGISTLFFLLPILVTFFSLALYISRRHERLARAESTVASGSNSQAKARKLILIITTFILFLLSAWLVDIHWDKLRYVYDIPARSVETKLLVGFTTIGVIATFLAAFIGLIELFDWLVHKQSD